VSFEALARSIERGEALVAGVLSGTSADGIDVGLVRFSASDCNRSEGRLSSHPGGGGGGTLPRLGAPELVAFAIEPYPPELAARVRELLDGGPSDLRTTALLDRDLGRAFGSAARRVAERSGLTLDLMGSHGQTVWHHDGVEPSGPATLQLGDGDFAAEAAGCAVISDFRQRDIAAGGEGAPLSALADDLIFARAPRPAEILNLGGMANLTRLAALAGEPEPGIAFDVGPAGSLLDGLARRCLDAPLDEGGRVAAGGRAHAGWVAELRAHPFFAETPPKSTGRDTFGEAWIDSILRRASELGIENPADLLASGVELIASTVAEALDPGSAELIVAGGGARNGTLMAALAAQAGRPVRSSAVHGVDPDAREALVFAVLAARAVLGEPLARPAASGAAPARILGKWSPLG